MSKIAIVTGGSSGIGLVAGRVLAERGYEVTLTARRPEPLEAAAASIGHGTRWVAADSSDDREFAAVLESVDHVDVLVHSAGVLDGTYIRKETLATFDHVIKANLRSAFITTSAVLTKMPAAGRIIYISSTSAAKGMKGFGAYSASKAGLNTFARTVAAEVERDGINVHILTVGPTDTPMIGETPFPLYALSLDDVAAAIGYLDSLPAQVVVRELKVRAAEEGPFAPEPVLSEAARKKRAAASQSSRVNPQRAQG